MIGGPRGRRAWASCALLACAGCGLLQSPGSALDEACKRLEAAPPVLDLGGGRRLSLRKLQLEPSRLPPSEGGVITVHALLWAEGRLGGASLSFHGPDRLALKRPAPWAAYATSADLPNLRGLAAALADRTPPAAVSAWQVGLVEQAEATVREEYVKDVTGRPVRAAEALIFRRDTATGGWTAHSR